MACSFQESQACRKRGRAGATQVPNGFQAPTLKAGVSCRLSSCAPFWRLVWPFLGAGGGGGQLWGQRGSEQPSCSSSSGPGAPGGAYAHVWEGVGPGPQGSFSGETHPLAHQEPCTPRFNRTLPSSHPSPQPTHPSHNTALGTKAHRALVTHTLTHNSPAWLQRQAPAARPAALTQQAQWLLPIAVPGWLPDSSRLSSHPQEQVQKVPATADRGDTSSLHLPRSCLPPAGWVYSCSNPQTLNPPTHPSSSVPHLQETP